MWWHALGNAAEVVYADGLDLDRARVGIGLSCRLCERPDCGSRAFPPLKHRLSLEPLTAGASPYRFEAKVRLGERKESSFAVALFA
jgi:XRE family transcriptional regulator, fatty acid utilization regulator